jgi:hypothetical protein
LPNYQSGKKKQYNSEEYPLINDVINLLSTVFSEKEETDKPSEDPKNESPFYKRMKIRREFEAKKREY